MIGEDRARNVATDRNDSRQTRQIRKPSWPPDFFSTLLGSSKASPWGSSGIERPAVRPRCGAAPADACACDHSSRSCHVRDARPRGEPPGSKACFRKDAFSGNRPVPSPVACSSGHAAVRIALPLRPTRTGATGSAAWRATRSGNFLASFRSAVMQRLSARMTGASASAFANSQL